jgi:hypothetical protein
VNRRLLAAVALGLTLGLAALLTVERVAGRHPQVESPLQALPAREPSVPSAAEIVDPEPSASPSLTR